MTSARSSRLTIFFVIVVLTIIGVALYISPSDSTPLSKVLPRPTVTAYATETSMAPVPKTKTITPTTTVPAPSTTPPPATTAKVVGPTATPTPSATTTTPDATLIDSGDGGAGVQTILGTGVPVLQSLATPRCDQFAYQQDAQTAYLANMSDPGGLDGGVGPFDGDGIACSQLPVDPARAASTPAGAYVPANSSAALKQSLLAPTGKYYGLTIDGVPGSTAKLDALNAAIGKTPSVLQFFTNWNQTADAKSAGYSGAFAAANVVKAWSRGALPVVTWQSQDSGFLPGSGKTRTDQPDYQLSKITAGAYDDYIRDFAVSIVKTNLPVVIRMDQEMNGNFYPWSEGLNGNKTGDYAAMWRHVWTIFQNVGANDSVIWEWAPNRVDKLGAAANKLSTLAGLYPGDQYVDWLALDAYWRTSTTATDWATTFGKSLSHARTDQQHARRSS